MKNTKRLIKEVLAEMGMSDAKCYQDKNDENIYYLSKGDKHYIFNINDFESTLKENLNEIRKQEI
jgi:hypothetical protein